jgi:hypothetical protein
MLVDATPKNKQVKQQKKPAQAPVAPESKATTKQELPSEPEESVAVVEPTLKPVFKVDEPVPMPEMKPAPIVPEVEQTEGVVDGSMEEVVGGDGKNADRFGALSAPTMPETKLVPIVPVVGAKFRCDRFEGDTSVVCVIEQVDAAAGAFIVTIPALNRRWPFGVENIVGDHLRFDAKLYPPVGQSATFDEKFRKHLAKPTVSSSEAALVATARVALPRAARPGHTWVKILKGPISAQGYTWEGKMVRGDHPMGRDEKCL